MKISIPKSLVAALAVAFAMTAHADETKSTFDLGAMIKNGVNKALNKNGIGAKEGEQGNAATSANYQKLTDTKLKDILKAYPVKDDMNPPAFPKLAIRITGYAKTLDQWSNRTNTPNECVNYNVTLWTSERKSEKFDNLRMCANDLAYNISFVSVRSPWPAKMNYNKSSGQVRDDGPVAPSKPYPNDPVARSFMAGGGVYYIGSMFIQMGYDWDYPHDTMRVWVSGVSSNGEGGVSTANNAGAAVVTTTAQPPAETGYKGAVGAYPAAGVYDASDRNFERTFTVSAEGKFELEVQQKGKAGNLRSGIGEGQLADGPGGWQFNAGNCKLTVRRGSGSVQLHAEHCASDWGDVPFDGRYQFKATPAEAKDATGKVAANGNAAEMAQADSIPTRKELKNNWDAVSSATIAGKALTVFTKRAPSIDGSPYSHTDAAVFVIDNPVQGNMNASELAKSPLKVVDIPLPPRAPNQGYAIQGNCSQGKNKNVVLILIANETPYGTPPKPVSAWALDANQRAVQVNPAKSVKCPVAETDI
ncbi:hypothetical protein [Rugamonas aquatica]|uniref:Uncharacterized protein n=1 Tax=Rugamonas aquatica TaxID=2743357 RepID=A0A6A7MWC9_9BURK|nr:hypothetical protein [Rugamonas aquatica]MQA37049.1 hypothetical protein [Rugamonas aquatica]